MHPRNSRRTCPASGPHRTAPLGLRVVQEGDHRVQAEEARGRPKDRPPAPVPRRPRPEVGPALLEGAFGIPSAGVKRHDLAQVEARRWLRSTRRGGSPPGRGRGPSGPGPGGPRLVPVARPGAYRDPPRPPAVPSDGEPATPPGRLDRLAGLGPATALDAGRPVAVVRQGRVEHVGLGVELADEGQPGAVLVSEAGDFVSAVARVADEHELAAEEAQEHDAEQPAHLLGRGPVRAAPLTVVLLGAVQVDQHGQRPGAGGEREADEDRQHHPAVAVLPGGVGVRGVDGVAVPRLAVDPLAGVAVDGVVADQDHRVGRAEVAQDVAGQGASQARPRGAGEDALVVGAVARGERPEGPEQVGDGAAALGEHGRRQKEREAPEGRPGEMRRERREQRPGLVG